MYIGSENISMGLRALSSGPVAVQFPVLEACLCLLDILLISNTTNLASSL